MSPERFKKIREKALEFLGVTAIDRTELKEFAGLVSWVASIIKAARPYTQMIWAAACAKPAGWETAGKVAARRVRLPMRWFAEMAKGGESVRSKCYLIQQPKQKATLTFDASLTGGGAWLQIHGGPMNYMYCDWTDEDWAVLGVKAKDPKHQPEWEAFMCLVAITTWAHLFTDDVGKLSIRGDAQGVLQAAIKGRARMPKLNEIIAEMQLRFAHTKFDLAALHIWSEKNAICDALSRLSEGAAFPEECSRWQRWPRLHREWGVLGRD